MAAISWSDVMSVGVPLVDADHRILIDLINQLEETVGDKEERAVLGSVLDTLVDYTIYHFAREEKVMEAAGYPDFEAHAGQHHELTTRVRDIERRYRAGETELGPEVLDFLKGWLTQHILKTDAAYRPYCEGNAEAVAAAEAVPRLQAPEAAGGDEAAVAAVAWGGLSALVVDDNPNFRRIARTILESVGVATVWEAVNGSDALEILKDFDADVVLCDWRMAAIDGIEFVEKLRAQGSGLPVVMMTGYSETGFRDRAMAAGVSQFLEKPVTARGVLVSVARAVRG